MSKLQIDLTGKGGLAPRFDGDYSGHTNYNLRYIGRDDQMAHGWYNPFKRYGYLNAANSTRDDLTVATGSPNIYIGSALYDMANNDFYVAERGAKDDGKSHHEVYRADGMDDTDLESVLDLGASVAIHDLEMYQINGVPKIFYAYDKNGTAEVGYASVNDSMTTKVNTWLTTTATGAFSSTLTNDVFMRVADDGFMYLFHDGNIHKLDGREVTGLPGTVTENVLVFPDYWQITDALNTNGLFYIPIRQDQAPPAITVVLANATVGVYVWDKTTTLTNMQNYIAIPGIREIRKIYVSPKGTIRVITINSEANVEIRELQGNVFQVLETIGNGMYPVYHDSLSVYGLCTTWLGKDGQIYCHGQTSEKDREGFFNIGAITSTAGPGIMVIGGVGTAPNKLTFYISDTTAGPGYRLYKWGPYAENGGGGTPYKGDVYTLVKFLPAMSTVNYLDIYCRPAGSGTATAATVKIYFNQSASAWATKTITLAEAGTGFKRIEINKPFVNAVQLEIEFSTAIAMSANVDFAPSYAILDYSPTKTKG